MKDEPQLLSFLNSTPDSTLYQFMLPADKLKLRLSKFGLTPNESKIFIFLGKYGPKTATETAKTLKVPRTETYRILSNLQNKGIVSSTFDHPTRFSMLSISESLGVLVKSAIEHVKSLESQKGEIMEIWDSIPSFTRETNNIPEEKFQILKGQNSIISNMDEMIGEAQSSLLLLGPERYFMKLYHTDSLDLLESSTTEIRILTSCSENSIPIFKKITHAKIKRLPYGIQNSLCFMIKDENELISLIRNDLLSAQSMMAIRTNSDTLVYTMKLLFDNVWSASENLIENLNGVATKRDNQWQHDGNHPGPEELVIEQAKM